MLSRPVMRTQVWSEATVTVGETQVAGQLGGSGTRLTILPLLDSNGLIVMDVRLENATHDDATDAEGTGTDAVSITTQVVSLIAELQAGQQLLVANGTSESKLTQFVQLTPRIVAENAAVNEVHNVRYQVRVFEIDHKAWSNAGDTSKRRQAFDDVLTPLAQGWHGHKLASGSIQAWATRDSVSDAEIASLQPALRQISSREFAIDDGEMAMFDYGGRSPQILMMERPQSGSLRSNYDGTHIQPLATTLAAESQMTDAGRIRLSVYYDSDRFLRRIQTSMDELKKNGSKVTAELSVGQTLCLCDVIPESSTISDGLLITLTPVEIRVQERTEKHPALVAKTAASVEQTFVVEDRWPIGEIRVGQRVIPVPFTIEHNGVVAGTQWLGFAAVESVGPKVLRIEPLLGQQGRRITLALPFKDTAMDLAVDESGKLRDLLLDQIRSATTTFVIPISSVSITDIYVGRLAQELNNQIPIGMRPKPIEVAVGDVLTLVGITSLFAASRKHGDKAELGPFSLECLDDDLGGYWRATATRPGMTSVTQMLLDAQSEMASIRLTDYLVKADTRELEHHIRQQFPKAQVTITSLGELTLILNGTVPSEAESMSMVEIAEQFAPKILSRLKVAPAAADESHATSDTPLNSIPAEPPRFSQVSATNSVKDDPLLELFKEIRTLRQEVRTLNERIEKR